MAKSHKSHIIKKNLLKVLDKNKGNISNACEAVGIDRKTYYEWREKDEGFKQASDEINDKVGDLVESRLMKNILSGRETSAIFYCKTKLRNRGYIEKLETENKSETTLKMPTLSIEDRKILARSLLEDIENETK